MALWRLASAAERERLANTAIVTRAAVATAIVNTIAGKDAPEFDEMIEQLTKHEQTSAAPAAPATADALAGMGIERSTASVSFAGMEDF